MTKVRCYSTHTLVTQRWKKIVIGGSPNSKPRVAILENVEAQ